MTAPTFVIPPEAEGEDLEYLLQFKEWADEIIKSVDVDLEDIKKVIHFLLEQRYEQRPFFSINAYVKFTDDLEYLFLGIKRITDYVSTNMERLAEAEETCSGSDSLEEGFRRALYLFYHRYKIALGLRQCSEGLEKRERMAFEVQRRFYYGQPIDDLFVPGSTRRLMAKDVRQQYFRSERW